jgi:hypothetical protein
MVSVVEPASPFAPMATSIAVSVEFSSVASYSSKWRPGVAKLVDSLPI